MKFNVGDLFVFNEDRSIAYIESYKLDNVSIVYGPGDTWQSTDKELYYTLNIPTKKLNSKLIYNESELETLINSNKAKHYSAK